MNDFAAGSVIDAPDRFARHPTMPFLMGGAHRKPADKVGPPALMRHVTIWRPTDQVPDGTRRQMAHDDWVKQIERFVLAIYFRLDSAMQHATLDRPTITNLLQKEHDPARLELLRNVYRNDPKGPDFIERIKGITRHETVRVSGTWQSIPLQISIERHTEYFTFTTVLDLSNRVSPDRYNQTNLVFLRMMKALHLLDTVATRTLHKTKPISEATARRRLIPV